jgi:hypothetical protein
MLVDVRELWKYLYYFEFKTQPTFKKEFRKKNFLEANSKIYYFFFSEVTYYSRKIIFLRPSKSEK